MKKNIAILLVAVATLVSETTIGEIASKRNLILDGVAAYVNERMITVADVMTELRNSVWVELPKEEREAKLRELYMATLNAMVDRHLILDAAKAAKAKIAPWAIEARIQEIIEHGFGGDRSKLINALKEMRLPYEQWRQSIEDDLMIQFMRYNQVERNVSVPPGDVQEFFAKNRDAFMAPGGVHVAMMVFTAPGDGSMSLTEYADKILKELNNGLVFAEAAKRYSVDAKATNGGDWGFVDPSEVFRKEIVLAIDELKDGAYSKPLLLEDHGYIVQKIAERKARQLTQSEAWSLAENRVRLQQTEERYKAWISRLRSRAYIKVFELP